MARKKTTTEQSMDSIGQDSEPKLEPKSERIDNGKVEAHELVTEMKGKSREKLIQIGLSQPFTAAQTKFLPKIVKGDRALAMPYIDARLVEDRLDEVLGIGGWCDRYKLLPDGCVMCRLSIQMPDGTWITKSDVGDPSDQPKTGDRMKAAFSDSLKRAAVKFGIGRYLARIPAVWADYDPQRKTFKSTPTLPSWAFSKASNQSSAVYHDEAEVGAEMESNVTTKPTSRTEETSSINGRQKQASQKTSLEERIKDWNIKLVGCENPEDLNTILPLLKNEATEHKGQIWNFICKQAREVGWDYDADNRTWFLPDEQTSQESIPF